MANYEASHCISKNAQVFYALRLEAPWELIRMNDHPIGEFWLDLRKFNNTWLITKDSTISY